MNNILYNSDVVCRKLIYLQAINGTYIMVKTTLMCQDFYKRY